MGGSLLRPSAWLLLAGSLLAAGGSCTVEPEPPPNDPRCPNQFPQAGGSCERGLSCHYAEVHPCSQPYFRAVCSAAGAWELDRPCLPSGEGGSGHGSAGAGGGGQGGSGECVDDIPGPPQVTSPLSVLYPPDAGSGAYALRFSEAIGSGIQARLSWQGAGAMQGVTKVGAVYLVRYAGMNPGDSATLTIDGVEDLCGNALAEPVDIDIAVRASCHHLAEDFEGDIFQDGWSAIDGAGQSNLWALSDDLSPPVGVENHSGGSGQCATTNAADSAPGSGWNSELRAPPIDLGSSENAVVHYRTALHGGGEGWLEGSSDGASWTPLAKLTSEHGPTREHVDVSAFKGGPLYLRWRYVDAGGLTDAYWDVDDVCVEEFTKPICNCPPGSFAETKDVAGFTNGNGDYATAEPTFATLSGVGQRVVVCGELEHDAASGADYYAFNVSSGQAAGPVLATVSYCLTNPFEDVSVASWVKSQAQPLASTATARGEGSFEVALVDGLQHFISLRGPAGYAKSSYVLNVEVKALSMPLLEEGFEAQPFAFSVSDDDPCLDWALATSTVVPYGVPPSEGSYLAYFNSYDCSSGSESLVSEPLSFAGAKSATLHFDMFHDTEYPSSQDSIQVEYEDGPQWLPIGSKVVRPAATSGWQTHSIDLTPLAGKPSQRIRLRATSEYGTNVHLDNIILLTN